MPKLQEKMKFPTLSIFPVLPGANVIAKKAIRLNFLHFYFEAQARGWT